METNITLKIEFTVEEFENFLDINFPEINTIINAITRHDTKLSIYEIFRYIMFCDGCDTINLLSFDKQFLSNLSLMINDFNLDYSVVNLIVSELYNSPYIMYHDYANAIANNV